jgi:hypothetical protein
MTDRTAQPRKARRPRLVKGDMSGWRLIGLYAYCVLLSALAAAFAAAFATAPYWIWPAQISANP